MILKLTVTRKKEKKMAFWQIGVKGKKLGSLTRVFSWTPTPIRHLINGVPVEAGAALL